MRVLNATDICNLALLRVNQNSIVTADAADVPTPQAQFVRMIYEQSKVALLSQYNWTFAITADELKQVATRASEMPIPAEIPNPTHQQRVARDEAIRARDDAIREERNVARAMTGFSHQYNLPAGFLRLVSLRTRFGTQLIAQTGTPPPFGLEGGFLLANQDGLSMKFVEDINDVPRFSPMFVDCFVLDLAIRLTKMFNDSTTYLQQLTADYTLLIEKAKISDCQQTMLNGMQSFPILQSTWAF